MSLHSSAGGVRRLPVPRPVARERRNPLERHHRDVLCSRIHTPQSDSVLVGAGRLALERAA